MMNIINSDVFPMCGDFFSLSRFELLVDDKRFSSNQIYIMKNEK